MASVNESQWEDIPSSVNDQEWEDVQQQPQNSPLLDSISSAVRQTPLGMASAGADAVSRGVGKVMDFTGIPISKGMQRGAQRIMAPARLLGIGVARNEANRFTGGSPSNLTTPYNPSSTVDRLGSMAGENAAVLGAGLVSPAVGGPLAMMTQQAQGGKVSPLPLLPTVIAGSGKLLRPVQERVVPPLLKATKGIPPEVSRMTIKDPSILELPGTSQSVQGRSQAIIDAVKEASRKVGSDYGRAYADQGMRSPVEEIKAGVAPKYIGKSFDELRPVHDQAMSGSLFNNRQDVAGAPIRVSPQDKLAELTDLKRGLQDQTKYAPAGQQLAPSDGARNAAIKSMAADIDKVRGGMPGGESLALADDAYHEMQEIRQTLISALKDPATGQDYLNRILKGNTDWLTSGRNAAKVGAIQRVEQITGKSVLQPALREMAAAYMKNPDTMGLSSTRLQSIVSSVVPARFLTNPVPKRILNFGRGLGQAASVGRSVQNGRQQYQGAPNSAENQSNQNDGSGNLNSQSEHTTPKKILGTRPGKVLTEHHALMYLKRAKNDPAAARRLASADGWTIPQ